MKKRSFCMNRSTKLRMCVANLVIVSLLFLVVMRGNERKKVRRPLFDDVNDSCFDSITINIEDVSSINYGRENDVDISDWDDLAICALTEKESLFERVVYPNIFGQRKIQDEQPEITLVTHFSDERLALFLRLVRHWPGPLSAAVQVAPENIEEFVNQYCRIPDLYQRTNIQIHLVLQQGIFYPYNHLRNVALDNAYTSHVFVSDSDLLPSEDLAKKALKHFQEGSVTRRQVMVVPSFEMLREDVPFPATKPDLIEAWDSKHLQEFYATRYAPAYMPLNYTIWRTALSPYKVPFSDEFEPYVIAERTSLQPYTKRFVGRFYNKATHSTELFCRGFSFVVAHDVFNVHMMHPSIHQKAFDAYFQCLYSLYNQFRNHLSLKYGVAVPPKAALKPDGKD